ncbi:molybdopterin guanine dinucleotide-containing S/N-oxide reductase [Roseicella aerolata]|uniref:Molybdopterin guanine dinucleotide-containing S/N-oxide reductase n=1 Tax=Roseicella aerolata TaxID=2883479 RepID=A0A9X1IAF6_9PROT|nr:molybdopterin guanine dinucleotide-containing S/N-oxide reductase [Roseicella aerolata]MCB4820917.1 molybdopterin guanine dinucleotide-containing S/N-oxide reductase [Roseicella aerolata]
MTGPDGRAEFRPHSAHWGVFEAAWRDGELVVRPHPGDPDPNRILQNFPRALRHEARIARPMIRRGWLEQGPGADPRRGRDEYLPVSWDRALDLVAGELRRVGAERIFGGSYGWSSAGRFHHAQSQVHRFLNTALGGYVRSVNSYSAGASGVLLPHVLGPMEDISRRNVTWDAVAQHSDLVLAFGGLALKNSMVAGGGISRHVERDSMRAAAERGCEFILVGPLRDDCPEEARAEWLPITPNTDTALMLALMHTLAAAGKHDRAFLDRYTTGWPVFEDYLTGRSDGQPKDAAWAAPITGIPVERITALAHRLVGRRVLVTVAHSLQRAEHGEQPVWAGIVLAAMLGQIGLPGGGYHYALGALGHTGRRTNLVSTAALSQGRNRVGAFIPVARIADMLQHPGEAYEYNGQRLTYPEIGLVYWAGGNPFHHHQDLNRLREAFRRVETLVVHEPAWTATARHADIVLPVTMTLEREDIGSSQTDPLMVAMHKLAEPYGEARDDYAIFAALAARLGREEAFTEGRSARDWLRHLYDRTAADMRAKGFEAPEFEVFWKAGYLTLPEGPDDGGLLRAFREDPEGVPLPTPSGRIEVFSATIAGFGYADCPGHPAWLAPSDVPEAAAPLHLVANQPATRLHSQLDFGGHSQEMKRRGREVARLHPADAAARGIADGDIVRLFNARGACLAAAELSEEVMPGVVNLPTGAWYDPEDPAEDRPLCVHGNPNVLTRDIGTSRLAQGCTGQLTTVEVERFTGNLPPIRAFTPPGAVAAE